MPKPPCDNELACKLFFKKVNPDNAACLEYECKICGTKRRKNKSGYTNLTDHLSSEHAKWREVLARAKSKTKIVGSMDRFLKPGVIEKYKNIYRWLNWIIKGKLPFMVCENIYFRKYTRLDAISRNTLMKYMHGVFERLKKKLAKIIPDTFGGIFDGWTCSREHYIAFFATWVTREGNVATRSEEVHGSIVVGDGHHA